MKNKFHESLIRKPQIFVVRSTLDVFQTCSDVLFQSDFPLDEYSLLQTIFYFIHFTLDESSFPLRISLVNVTRSAENGFGHIY